VCYEQLSSDGKELSVLAYEVLISVNHIQLPACPVHEKLNPHSWIILLANERLNNVHTVLARAAPSQYSFSNSSDVMIPITQ
jgi:hypothetical protein